MGLTARYEQSHRSLRPDAPLRDIAARSVDELRQEQLITQWLNLSPSQRAQRKQDYRGRQLLEGHDRARG